MLNCIFKEITASRVDHMRHLFFFLLIISLFSCRKGDEDVQKIDQITHIYIDSAGQDMLNSKLLNSYIAVSMNDDYGITDNVPVSFTLKKTADTVNYLEYVAGAKRILVDSSDAQRKIYESRIALNMIKKTSDSTQVKVNDTLILRYVNAPDIFYLNEAFYNKVKVFSKTPGQPNLVQVHK